jgi:hypothetical protein
MAVLLVPAMALTSCTVVTGGTPPASLNYVSESYPVGVRLPPGWASAGGKTLMFHEEGLVAFNSWGEPGFWAGPENTYYPDGHPKSQIFGPSIIAEQVPPGGAYVALVRSGGPPSPDQAPEQYTSMTLDGLYTPHDWRTDAAGEAAYLRLYRDGSWLDLYIVCQADASDQTVDQLNQLMAGWRFLD